MSTNNIEVAIRMRPLIAREVSSNEKIKWKVQDNTIRPVHPSDSRSDVYQFDHIFDTDATNKDVYNKVVAPLVTSCVEGYHCTIFAYGHTSSGKTHTMHGTIADPGIIPQVVDQLFNIIDMQQDSKFLVRVAYVEMYNDRLYDLLKKKDEEIKVRQGHDGSMIILSEELVTSTKTQILDVMKVGKKNRKMYSTKMNFNSSRSHTIFRIIVENSGRSEDGVPLPARISHFNLVDLAGSERVAQTGATGQQLVEGAAINKSLSTLTLVISQILGANKQFRNYRDSKLTFVLKNALGGNGKTLIVANVTPASMEDTHSTLLFASRAKTIKNRAVINTSGGEDSLLVKQELRIKELEHDVVVANETTRRYFNLLIQLNKRAFAKGKDSSKLSQSKDFINVSTGDLDSSSSDFDIINEVTSSDITLTTLERGILRVQRVNAIERMPSATSIPGNIPQELPFEAHLDSSFNDIVKDKDNERSQSPDIALVDYSVCEDDLIESSDDDKEFLDLEEANKTLTADLHDELKKSRAEAQAASENYAQQLSLNVYLRNTNQTLMEDLSAAKEKNAAMGTEFKKVGKLTKELETRITHKNEYQQQMQQELNENREQYSQIVDEKKCLEDKMEELIAKNAELAKKNKKLKEEQSRKSKTEDSKIHDLELSLNKANQEAALLREELQKVLPAEATTLVYEYIHESQTTLQKTSEDSKKKVNDIKILKENIEELTIEKDVLESNLLRSEQDLVQKHNMIELLKKERETQSQKLKVTQHDLEKAEDDVLELSQCVDAIEKKSENLSRQNTTYQTLLKFMDTHFKSKTEDIKNVVKTMKVDSSKRACEKLIRVKSLPSLTLFQPDQEPSRTGSLQNIELCVHDAPFREIHYDLSSLSQVLSYSPGTSKSSEIELQQKIAILQNKIDRYELDMTVTDNENSQLKQRNQYLEKESTRRLKLAKEELKHQLKTAEDKFIAVNKSFIESLHKEKKIEKKYAHKADEYKELHKKYDELNKTHEDLKAANELETMKKSGETLKIENENKHIKSRNEKYKSLCEDYKTTINELLENRNALQEELRNQYELISNLQASNAGNSDENETLSEKIDLIESLERRNDILKEKVKSLEKTIQSKSGIIESNLQLNTQLKETIKILQEKIAQTQSVAVTQSEIGKQNEKLTEENKQLLQKLNQLHGNIEVKSRDISNLEVENVELRTTLLDSKKTSENEIRSLREQRDRLQVKCQEAVENADKQTATSEKLRQELESVQTKAEARNQLNDSKIKRKEETIKDLNEKVDALHEDCDSTYQMVDIYQQKVSEIGEENKKLKVELKSLIEVNNKIRENIWDQKEQAEDFEKQINSLLEENDDLSTQLATNMQKTDTIVKENQELWSRIQQAQNTFDKRYNTLSMENTQLLQQNEMSQATIATCNTRLAERDSCLLSLKSSHDVAKSAQKKAEREKNALQNRLHSMEILIKEQEGVLKNERDSIKNLNAENEALKMKIKLNPPDLKMEWKLKKYTRKLSDLEEEKVTLIATIASLEDTLKQKETKKEFDELRKMKEKLEVEATQLRSELHTTNKELRRYKNRCVCDTPPSTSSAIGDQWKTKRRVAQDSLRDKEQGKETECPRCKKYEEKLFNLECEMIAVKDATCTDLIYQSKLEGNEKEIKKLRQSNEQLQQQLKEIQAEQKSLKSDLSDRDKLIAENKKIKEKYQQVKAVASRRNEQIQSLQSQLEKK